MGVEGFGRYNAIGIAASLGGGKARNDAREDSLAPLGSVLVRPSTSVLHYGNYQLRNHDCDYD
jgi:hypothetical protein